MHKIEQLKERVKDYIDNGYILVWQLIDAKNGTDVEEMTQDNWNYWKDMGLFVKDVMQN